ncbi:uncharacterized protein LY79DRAFT_676283 [Colletotrichum navitas]|uniref:Uncharacterized protein n=1 Tax=Colletotrichum navitas TaxID=681940 RepID=A0AAD8VBF9_9PEZI|nr:uncharacterized protein LY79DRAFT_676283 [Colletotrichum navitas]KAK1600244.1 hypothetical protein LY79DRAFT_676283 [Colletotrichum navitas]
MEGAHVQRRSVSHGSLRSSYKNQARMHVLHSLPHRPPLKSVNENASLLSSPGPLESMLKTTTETGDIGIFSIKPVAPATTIHHYARSRSGLDAGSIFGTSTRTSDGTTSRAGRRWRGSDRDTNSEIVSLYGSEDPTSSLSSSLSPRIGGACQRSYSLTTCGSRHKSSQKSSGTMQSQSSSGILQRPRSPFPYPTRLKRLGMRPSSPALTENGHVDYSRMVEIDRISYRTVHGSYKPTFPQPQRLAPPLAFSPNVNQSMPSLPYPKSLASPTGSIARDRGYNYWSNGYLNRERRPSADQSVRSSSLTSVIEMYCRLPSGSEPNLQRTIRPAGSFYYDYTEGFENPYSQADCLEPRAASPLAPIPQRASSLVKALVLRDEKKAHLDAVMDISVKDSSDSSGDYGQLPGSKYVNNIDTLPSQRMKCKTAPPTLEPFTFEVDGTSASRPADFGVAPGLTEALSPCIEAEKTQPSLIVQEVPTSMHCKTVDTGAPADKEQPDIKMEVLQARTDQSPPSQVTDRQLNNGCQRQPELLGDIVPRHDKIMTFGVNLTAKEHPSRRASSRSGLDAVLRSSLRHSVDPGLPDLAALVSSFEHIAKPPFIGKDKQISTVPKTADQADLQSPQQPGVDPTAIDFATDDGAVVNAETHPVSGPKKPFHKGHRRNRALANIRTASLQARRTASVSSVGFPLPVTEFASATAALRVSTSNPYLMKALPILPNNATTPAQELSKASAEDLGFPVKFSPFQLELLATPRSSPRITAQKNVEDHESFRASIELEVAPADSAQPFTKCPSTVGGPPSTYSKDIQRQIPSRKRHTSSSPCRREPCKAQYIDLWV